MNVMRTTLACLSILVLLSWSVPSFTSAQDVFLIGQVMMPNGIGADALGNITVHSDAVNTTLLTTFAPNGVQIRQTSLGAGPAGAAQFAGSHLALDPDPLVDLLYLLSPEGDVVIFDTNANTLNEIDRFHILDLPVMVSNVYNAATGSRSDTFVLSPVNTIFGDIAVFPSPPASPNPPAWFVTGLSNGQAFVMRIVMGTRAAKVVLMSTLSSSSPFPPGVAIATTGVGFTTLSSLLPSSASAACPDVVVRFDATAPEATAAVLSDATNVPLTGIPSSGIGTDRGGNVYLATGGMGNTACLQGGGGHMVYISNPLAGVGSIRIPLPLTTFPAGRPGDVAVSPVDNRIYMTLTNFNAVVRFPALAPITP